MKSGFRHLGRTLVLKAIFWYEVHPGSGVDFILDYLLNNDEGKFLPDESFTKTTFLGVVAKLGEIDPIIVEYAPSWPLDKIAKVDLAILRLGIYELLFNDDVPTLVAINEAVELAKEFGDKSSSQFVNGVLSGLAKSRSIL